MAAGGVASVLIHLDQGGFGAAQGDTAVGDPALDRIAERRPLDHIDFCPGNESEVEEPLACGPRGMVAMNPGPAAGFYIVKHAAFAAFSIFASMSAHRLSDQGVLQIPLPQSISSVNRY